MKPEKKFLRICIALSGLIFCGLGVGSFLFANLGVDPASVLMDGIGKTFQLTYGTSSAIINSLILVIVFLVDRKYINISSILAIFGIGYTADFANKVLLYFLGSEIGLPAKVCLMIGGLIIMGIGVATYIQAELGVGAIDLIAEIISDKTKIQYRIIRVSSDAILLISGYLLGGAVGVGTVVAVVFTGPIVQFVRPFMIKVVNKMLLK